MRYKAVIFDLDGTLLDTIDDLADSMNAVLMKHGFSTYPVDNYKYFVGNGMEQLVRAAMPSGYDDERLIMQMVEDMRCEYNKRWNAKTKPYDDIRTLLLQLEKRGLIICVLSNKPDDFTKLVVKNYFPYNRWSVIYGQRPNIPRKPHPAGALEIALELDLTTDEILYLGDTNTDMKTAKSAGMFAVGALWGFRTKNELIESGADTVISAPLQLLEMLE